MKVLLVGSGGREHALALKISQSPSLSKLYIAPGNPGTASLGENVNLPTYPHSDVVSFCKEKNIELVVVGPELPLVDGLADYLIEAGIKVFGPTKLAARIEGDKSFSKNLMEKYNIPTAKYEVFNLSQYTEAKNYVSDGEFPIVIKASGLAAGKGVAICENEADAFNTLKEYFEDKVFGAAGENIVIEEFMIGLEASIFAITDGTKYYCLPAAQDHKRIGDGDTGKNTGGMGAYAPAPLVSEELLKEINSKIITPTLEAMKSEGCEYRGCLYAGIMITKEGPKVVEFNCRFGDPETQCVLPLVDGDFLQFLYSSAVGDLKEDIIKYNGGASVCVVAASKGYPESYEKGFEINGLKEYINSDEVIIYHAGTKLYEGKIITNGGRVLGITSVVKQNDLSKSKSLAYEALDKVNFEGIIYRKDISDKANQVI